MAQAQLFRRIDAGQTAEIESRWTHRREGDAGCRTNHREGLKELQCYGAREGSRNRCRDVGSEKEHPPFGVFQLDEGSHASCPVSYPTV